MEDLKNLLNSGLNDEGVKEKFAAFLANIFNWLGNLFSFSNKKAMEEEQTTNRIEALLVDLTQEVKQISDKVGDLESKLDSLTITVNGFSSDKDKRRQLDRLREDIQTVGYNVIELYKPDTDLESLILEGCNKAGDFFCDILSRDLSSVDTTKLYKSAKRHLRALRAQFVGPLGLATDVTEEIKVKVAEPAILRLLARIQNIKTNSQPHTHTAEIIKASMDFVETFIVDAINITKQHK